MCFGCFFIFLSIVRFVLVLKEKLRRKMMFHKKTKETLNNVKSITCTYFKAGNRLKYLFVFLTGAVFGPNAHPAFHSLFISRTREENRVR